MNKSEEILNSNDPVDLLCSADPSRFKKTDLEQNFRRVTVEMIAKYLQAKKLIYSESTSNSRQFLYKFVKRNRDEFVQVLQDPDYSDQWGLARSLGIFKLK